MLLDDTTNNTLSIGLRTGTVLFYTLLILYIVEEWWWMHSHYGCIKRKTQQQKERWPSERKERRKEGRKEGEKEQDRTPCCFVVVVVVVVVARIFLSSADMCWYDRWFVIVISNCGYALDGAGCLLLADVGYQPQRLNPSPTWQFVESGRGTPYSRLQTERGFNNNNVITDCCAVWFVWNWNPGRNAQFVLFVLRLFSYFSLPFEWNSNCIRIQFNSEWSRFNDVVLRKNWALNTDSRERRGLDMYGSADKSFLSFSLRAAAAAAGPHQADPPVSFYICKLI